MLPTDRESPRYEARGASTRVVIEGRTSIRIPRAEEPLTETEAWLAISLPEGFIESTIRLPDGSVATDARVVVRCDAVRVCYPPPPGFWRTLRLSARVSMEGYEGLKFVLDPQKRAVIRILVPKTDDSGP